MIIETKFLFWLKWVSTVVCLTGAVMTSLQIVPYNIIAFSLGSTLFLIWSIGIKDKAMITINAGFLTIYALGAISSFLR
jgi:hypothetical protein